MSHFIEWSERLVTGVAEVDAHHKALVGLVNALHEAVHRRRGVDACRETVEKLRRCALSHLDAEERLMHEAGYAGFREDLDEQRELIFQLDDMLARMDAVNSNITFQALHGLKTWLLNHIRDVDPARWRDQVPVVDEGVKVFGMLLKRS